MFFLHIYGLIIFLYIATRLIAQLPFGRAARLALTLWALAGSQYHLAARNFLGTLASPEMPYPLLVAWSLSFVTLALTFALLLIRDLFRVAVTMARAVRGRARIPFSPGRRAVVLGGAGLALGVYGFREAVRPPDTHTTEVMLDRLPRELDGFTLVQITDLHATALLRAPRVEALVEAVNALDPGLIVCTGDLVDGSTDKRAAAVAPLAELRARYGVFSCEGNHEYYSGHAAWMRAFDRLGLNLMHNESVVLSVNGKQLVLAGLNDLQGPRFGNAGPDLAKALGGTPEDAPVILLAHQPLYARANAFGPRRVDVQLSGHTHGGQIWGFDRIVASRNDGFLRHWYDVGTMKLHVSPGAGLWTGFPVRLGVPAEISRIVLRSARA